MVGAQRRKGPWPVISIGAAQLFRHEPLYCHKASPRIFPQICVLTVLRTSSPLNPAQLSQQRKAPNAARIPSSLHNTTQTRGPYTVLWLHPRPAPQIFFNQDQRKLPPEPRGKLQMLQNSAAPRIDF
ncbi:hypothetical protein M0657_007342 [Pyricularia oryzae]|uniref:Uncharacterized protein n=1 Tax=Pyricularia oryzae TaxID=318829 RepID=A0A4P7NA88_PYROR|nr:hypothetical protein MCOR23_007606 [Pyricularia oryzae]KAI6412608.1 hypothetical protein MCOR24_006691 [Pyricularia oryzae]KAI6537908.1 hypothetical protein MCOR05_005141 [Pyricularia oryzae]KAI6593038.1 hypothetical protein MCOR06_003947 [Pyricularia oryzae]KAI7918956.1 hypothetical protein M0657_007342 [Pyricularia oryzae]